MKKVLALILALTFVLLMASCAGKPTTDTTTIAHA